MNRAHATAAVLAGDVGGTKTVLALCSLQEGRLCLKVEETYSSREAKNLEQIIDRFIAMHREPVTSACIGIAGPVKNGRCITTNLPWHVSESSLKERFGWKRVELINDLAAWAYGVPILNQDDYFPLNTAATVPTQNQGLVAPGTGLGEALLVYIDGKYVALPSEGGHVDFAPNNEVEVELWRYLHRRFGHVSVERVLSGPGLFNIYSWLRDFKGEKEPAWLAERIDKTDPPKAITEAAIDQEPLCRRALALFVSIFGAVAGNLALTGTTTGGIYLCGGIPPRILSFLTAGHFMEAFVNKGRFQAYLEQIAVRVILNGKTPLLGAAQRAFEMQQSI